jgi:hypothetical protein
VSAVYPSAVDKFLGGDIDAGTATVKAQLTDGYVYSAAHDTLSDVGAGTRVGTAVTVTVDSIAGGELNIDPITFPSVATGKVVDGVVFYIDAGAGEANVLLCHIDRRADTVPLAITTNDGNIVMTWPRLLKL